MSIESGMLWSLEKRWCSSGCHQQTAAAPTFREEYFLEIDGNGYKA
jgi:hypothetical protein